MGSRCVARRVCASVAPTWDEHIISGPIQSLSLVLGTTGRSVPVLYSTLLWTTRNALRTGNPTALSEATAFLWGDYKVHAFWWEPFEMCRKLSLTVPFLGFEPLPLAFAANALSSHPW